MPADPTPARKARRSYYYRRPLALRELGPAIGVGIGVGLAAFYVTRLLLERTPLVPAVPGAPPVRAGRAGRPLARPRA